MKSAIFTIVFLGLSLSSFATTGKKQLHLEITSQHGFSDQTTIYFDLGISPGFQSAEDAPKIMSSVPGVPNIYSLSSDNVKCSVNGYSPLTQSAVVGIGLLIDSAAQYTFRLPQQDNFDSTSLIILEDRKLNVFTELQINFYQVQLTPEDTSGRFFLHVTSAVQSNTVTAGCDNNNGEITLSADNSIPWNSISLSYNYSLLNSYQNAEGQLSFNNLAEGTYNITFNYNGYIATKNIFVPGNYITTSISASSQNVAVGETISFSSTTINTTSYAWQFGDSTTETGVQNPTYFYYIPGVFTVTLTCSNHEGCSAVAQTTITVTETTGIINPATKELCVINPGAKTIQVIMNYPVLSNAELQIYNILGQSIYTGLITASEMQVSLSDQPPGIYLVTVKNGSKNMTTKIYIN